MIISIHAPRTGSDLLAPLNGVLDDVFQSTLPARGATRADEKCGNRTEISIHAPRTGSDSKPARSGGIGLSFQSTLPARGATCSKARCFAYFLFQSTLPARGATSAYRGL